MRRCLPLVVALAAAAAITIPTSSSDAQEQCRLHAPLQPTRLLRRTSLALLGRVPSLDEYTQVIDVEVDGDTFESVIDSWLDSDEFRVQMRRYHMQLLWTNPVGVALRDVRSTLNRRPDGNGGDLWAVLPISRMYRGGDGSHICQDVPQTSLQPSYQFGEHPTCQPQGSDGIGAFCQEGYVNVNPYWDPSSTIRVCAFDAQTALTYTKPIEPNPGEYSCNTWQAKVDDVDAASGAQPPDTCGCGPGLSFCMTTDRTHDIERSVTEAMQEQLLRSVDDYTRGQAPYTELLTTKRAYLNGPLTHFFKYLAPMASTSRVHSVVYGDVPLQDVKWVDSDGWYPVERGDLHAGILTLPAYLLRFQTNRGRANRFRIAFMGQYFVPSETPSPGCDPNSDDVAKKCLCDSCHQTLEPMSMYFGSFVEGGSASLYSFGTQFFGSNGNSAYKECSYMWPPDGKGFCVRFYASLKVQDPDNPGDEITSRTRRPLRYYQDHEEYLEHYNSGPTGMLNEHALKPLSGKEYSFFAAATVRNLFKFLIGRELDLDPLSPEAEQELLDDLALKFQMNDYNFKQLAKDIVTLKTFRRMP